MAIKICPECGGKVAGTRNDCPHCGYIFPETFKCPECGSDIPQNSKECPVCGYAIGNTETETLTKTTGVSAAIPSDNSLSYSGKLDGVFSVVQDYNADDFSRELYIYLAMDSSTPSDIISACTINPVVIKKVPHLVVDTFTQVEFSCSVGYDREEQYWEEVEKRDSQGNRYKTKELKTRIVTDWRPFNGTNSGNDILTVANVSESYFCTTDIISAMKHIPYTAEDRALFGNIVPSPVALSEVADSAKRACAESAKKPGDHQKDLSYHGKVDIKSVKAVVVPHFEGSYNYDGHQYAAKGYAAGLNLFFAKRPSIEESENSIIKKKTRPTFIISVILTVLMIAVGVVLEMLSMLGIFGNEISTILMIVAGVLAVVFLVLIVLTWIIYSSIKKTLKNIFTFVRQAQKIKDIHEEFTKRGWQFLTESEFNSICSPELTESTQKTVIKKTDQIPFSKRLGIHYKNYVLSRALKLCGTSEDDNNYTSDNTATKSGNRKKRRKTGKIVTAVVSIVLVVALGLGLGLGFGLNSNSGSDNGNVHNHNWSDYIDDGDEHYRDCWECKEIEYDKHTYNTNGYCICGKANPDISGHTTHNFVQVVSDEYLKQAATCYSPAIYYFSCECGEHNDKTFEYGEPDYTLHNYSDGLCLNCSELQTKGLQYNNEGTITGINDKYWTVEIIIPSKIQGITTTSIGTNAFSGCSNLTSITIPDSVTSIGEYAFYDCSNLTSITIPDSVTSIGEYAFYDCSSLTSITIPDSVTSIDEYAFRGCSNLTGIVIPDSVTRIGEYAFRGCSNLTSITIPDSVTEIGNGAFYSCSSLTSLSIPSSVTEIGSEVFYGCRELTSITIPDGVTSIGESAFYNCDSLESVTIGNSVTNIGSSAFYGCSSLTSITIPSSVTTIGSSAFKDCSGLTSITIPDRITSIGDSAFSGCSSLTNIEIPDSVTTIGNNAFYNCANIESATMPTLAIASIPKSNLKTVVINGGDRIGEDAFRSCDSLTSVTIPNSVTSSGEDAFLWCDSLTSVYYTGDIASWCGIGFENYSANPLYYVDNLYINNELITTELVIPNTVTKISNYVFSGCSSLTSIEIPNTVTSIGYGAFEDCNNLESVTMPTLAINYIPKNNLKTVILNGGDSIGNYAFRYCSGLTSITIPNSVTSIGEDAFWGCSSLTSIEIPNTVTSIGEDAFSGCSNLESATIPTWAISSISKSNLKTVIINGGDSIGNYAFRYCSGLTSITIPNSVTSIGYEAFYDCNSLENVYYTGDIAGWCGIEFGGYYNANPLYYLYIDNKLVTELVIPDTVTEIKGYTFSGCSSLTSITIPDSVTEIGNGAFYSCSSLTSITIPDKVTTIGEGAFRYCSSLKSVTIPNSVTSIDEDTFYGCSNLESATMPTCAISVMPKSNLKTIVINGGDRIGEDAFYDCSSLTSVTIGNSVKSIETQAFRGCSSLTSITIPDSVTTIGSYAFEGCDSLESVYYTGDIAGWCGIEFENYYGNYYANPLYYADNLYIDRKEIKGELTIPDTVTEIKDYSFYGCSLTSITIPDSVTSIGSSAFYNCNSLESATIPTWVISSIPKSNLKTVVITVGDSIGNYAFYDCSSLTNVTIGNSVTSIGNYAFHGCSSLTSITIPDSVTTIGSWIFDGCSSLESATIPAWAISAMPKSNLKTVVITVGDSIGGSAFSGYSSLTSITIPNSVTSIGYNAFNGCNSLESVYYTGDIAGWCEIAFGSHSANPLYCAANLYIDNKLVTELIIPDTITEIKNCAFERCNSLTSVTIGNSVTSIGYDAFSDCRNLETVYWNATACTSAGGSFSSTFNGCSKLTEVIIDNDVTTIPDYAFYDCSGLTSVTIGNSVTSIGEYAFECCRSLTSITIGNSVTSIGTRAFLCCSSLTSVTIPDSVTSIDYSAFYSCSRLTSVTIGNSVKSIGKEAFYGCSGLTNVYYKGTKSDWNKISIGSNNTPLTSTTRYYYSVTNPPLNTEGTDYDDNYWCYDDENNIVVWKKDN